MSRLVQKVGLAEGAGLFEGAGLYKYGRFDPLSLNPYLLFDAETSMRGTLEAFTLDLDPANPASLDVITATRAGTATFTDANGVIQSASADTVRVDYTQGAELTPTKYQRVGYTDFNNATLWAKNDATLTSGQLSPTGDNTATKLTATGLDPYVYAIINTSAQTHTFSFYCKGEGPTIGKTARVLFWYIGGATGTTQSVDFTYSGEWQRFEFQTTPTGAGTLYYRIDIPSNTGVVGESVYIYGPQLEEGTTASSFVANTTGSPLWIASPTFGPRVPMILVEPSATNLVADSNTFLKGSPVVRLGTTFEAPDGTNTAEGYGSIPATSGVEVSSQTASISPNTQYVSSVWVKGEAGKTASFFAKRSGGTFVQSNFVTVTLTGEWQRVTGMVMTTLSDNTGIIVKLSSSTLATQADEVYLWGAQVEAGSVSTSVIPTSGGDAAARTRAKDDLVISGSAFTDFYNASEGTIYVESITRLSDGVPFVVEADNGTNNRIALYYESNEVRGFLKSGGVSTANPIFGNRPTAGNLSLTALSYKTNDFEGSVDGGSVVVDTSATIPTTINRFHLGSRFGQSDIHKLNGHIKRLIYWPTHSDSL